jgi:hypothetical protein
MSAAPPSQESTQASTIGRGMPSPTSRSIVPAFLAAKMRSGVDRRATATSFDESATGTRRCSPRILACRAPRMIHASPSAQRGGGTERGSCDDPTTDDVGRVRRLCLVRHRDGRGRGCPIAASGPTWPLGRHRRRSVTRATIPTRGSLGHSSAGREQRHSCAQSRDRRPGALRLRAEGRRCPRPRRLLPGRAPRDSEPARSPPRLAPRRPIRRRAPPSREPAPDPLEWDRPRRRAHDRPVPDDDAGSVRIEAASGRPSTRRVRRTDPGRRRSPAVVVAREARTAGAHRPGLRRARSSSHPSFIQPAGWLSTWPMVDSRGSSSKVGRRRTATARGPAGTRSRTRRGSSARRGDSTIARRTGRVCRRSAPGPRSIARGRRNRDNAGRLLTARDPPG